MKVLGLVFSPRKGGNTEILVREALTGAKEAGAKVELLSIAGKDIKPCDGCLACFKTGKCHIKDDLPAIFDKLLVADGIIFGSPSYGRGLPGQAKSMLDRCVSLRAPSEKLQNKVGAPIAVTAGDGAWNVITTLYLFFITHHMFCADCVGGFAWDKGEVRKNEFAMKASWELGKQVVALVSQGLEWPKGYEHHWYFSIAEKYGLQLTPYA